MTTRREFIGRAGTVAGAAALGVAGYPGGAGAGWHDLAEPGARGRSLNQQGLRILILGGTGFIGPHVVRHALARGHEITLFNRGRTNTHLFPEVEKLVGDRNSDLTALEGRRWDAVLDNSGYTPHQVGLSVGLLKDATDQYLFTSTRAVYTDFTAAVMDEDAPIGPRGLPESEWTAYGPAKVLAERAVEEGFGARTLIVRPPVIVGPGDRSDRFTYWPDRIDAGGEVLVQGDPTDPVQFIDARDLASWVVGMLEDGVGGVFNGAGPVDPLTMGTLLETCRQVGGGDATFHWIDAEFIEEQKIFFPIWSPTAGDFGGAHRIDISRAIATGYRNRPLADTVRDTLEWWKGLGEENRPGGALRAGPRKPGAMGGEAISTDVMLEMERELLEAWAARA